jgi:branched-chain amino acid transport system substrate-binding protein
MKQQNSLFQEIEMLVKRSLLATVLFALTAAAPAVADDTPGVTATEIKIGNTDAYSGPASAYGVIAKLETAFFKMVNDQGGVAGHKINFISLDDGYSPPKTVEQVRRLIEEDQVALLFNTLGTPTNSAIVRYVNQKKVPQLFISTGADKWGDYQHFPWTMGFQASFRTEARIYAKYILKEKPNAKIAILYQNDDLGKDYLAGMKDVLGDNFDKMVVTASYETTDPTIDSQITSLQAAGANVLLVAAIPKFAAQAIRKVHDLDWKPLFFMSNVRPPSAQ